MCVSFDGLGSDSAPICGYFLISLIEYGDVEGGKFLSAFLRSVLSPSSVPGSPNVLKMEIETISSSETSVRIYQLLLCNI